MDARVKVRGYLVDLTPGEAALQSLDGVREAAAVGNLLSAPLERR